MTKGAAIQEFFSRFDMEAFAAASVPEDVTFPYLTYELVLDSVGGGETSMTVNLWFYTDSEAIPNAKAQEIAEVIGLGGVTLPCDGGYVWLKRGSPWCQSVPDDTAPNVKRRYLNVTAEFLTAN